MIDVITVPGAPMPASVEQLAVPRAMIAATEPYHLAKRLVSTFDEALEIFDSDIVRVDDRQQLICLQNARTELAIVRCLLFAFVKSLHNRRSPWYEHGLVRKPLRKVGVILLHDVEYRFLGEPAMVLGK